MTAFLTRLYVDMTRMPGFRFTGGDYVTVPVNGHRAPLAAAGRRWPPQLTAKLDSWLM
jgi:hypothetical protein